MDARVKSGHDEGMGHEGSRQSSPPPVPAAALDTVRDYIADTEARVRSLFDAGTPLSAIVHAAHLPRYAGWAMYEPVHGRNVQQRYLALERATLAE